MTSLFCERGRLTRLGGASGWRGMLVGERIGRVRRERFVKKKPIKEIARELKVARNTVRKVLRSGAISFEQARASRHGAVQRRPKLGRWDGDLDRIAVAGWGEAKPRAADTSRP